MKKLLILVAVLSLFAFSSFSIAAPEAPVISYATDRLNVDIKWTAVDGATGYKFYFAPYPYQGPETISSIDVGMITGGVVPLWEGAAFYIAVEAYDGTGSSISNIENFILTAEGDKTPAAPLDLTEEFTQTTTQEEVLPSGGDYFVETFTNADTAQRQIEEDNYPNVIETQGDVLVLDIAAWPLGWDIMKVVTVRMPEGQVEYKRILNLFELNDGRFAIGALEVSALEVLDSGTIALEGRLPDLISEETEPRSFARGLVTIVDDQYSEEIDIFKKTDVSLYHYDNSVTTIDVGFPEISLTATPTLTFQLIIDKPFGISDVIGGISDVAVNVIVETKSQLEEIDGAVHYDDGRGIVSAGVDLNQADQIVNRIKQVSDIAEKLDAIVSALRKPSRIKLAYASLSGDVEGFISLVASASAIYHTDGEMPLGTVLVPITGPVPLFLSFDLAGIYALDFDAAVEASTSLTLTIPLDASVSIVDGEFLDLTTPSFSPELNFEPPSISGEGELEASAGIQLGVGVSLAGILNTNVNTAAEAVFESSASAEASFEVGVCGEFEWDLYGRISSELEAELDIKILTVEKAWPLPLNFTFLENQYPYGIYEFGTCSGGGDILTRWYRDADGDDFGDPNTYQDATTAPTGYVADNTDCDDTRSSVHPGATEIANDGIDQDCDGEDSIANTGEYAGFRLSSERAAYGTDYNQVCVNEFGSEWSLADWVNLVAFYEEGGNLNTLAVETDFVTKGSAWVTRNGDPDYSDTRDYFASYHNHSKPSGYLAHDNIDSYNFSLGSWDGTYYVLCKTTSSDSSPSVGGVILEPLTDLLWQDDADVATYQATWEDAGHYCDSLTLGGFTDWRLPTFNEMYTVLSNQACGVFNTPTPQTSFWTSTPHDVFTGYYFDGWFFDEQCSVNSNVLAHPGTDLKNVRCVRD